MKKILSLLMILALSVACLVGCGSKNDNEIDPDYTVQTVKYDGAFKITCIKDEVICDKDSSIKTDNLVITVKVKNIGKEDAKITSVANVITKQGDKTLYSSYLKDKKGKLFSFYRDQIIKKGEEKTLKYSWQLENSEDDVNVNFNGYVTGADAGVMKFKVKGRQTKEHEKYVAESKKEYESKAKVRSASLKACDVKVPDGWIIRSVSDSRIEMQKDKNDGPTEILAITSYEMKIKSAKAEAERYIGNFNNSKLKVETYKIGGEKFYGFEPVDTQFYLYGVSSDGYRIEVTGMQVKYKDVKKILDKMIKVK